MCKSMCILIDNVHFLELLIGVKLRDRWYHHEDAHRMIHWIGVNTFAYNYGVGQWNSNLGLREPNLCLLLTPVEKSYLFLLFILFFLDTDPHLASVVCVLYLFSVSRYELCVCGNLCACVCVWAQIWSCHQPWEILRCDWAPMSIRFYLI